MDPDDEDDFDWDDSELCCPKCGCNHCEILRYPDDQRWFQQHGQAQCGHCRIIFEIRAAVRVEVPAEPLVTLPPAAAGPPTVCPKCRGRYWRYVVGGVAYRKCKECGHQGQ